MLNFTKSFQTFPQLTFSPIWCLFHNLRLKDTVKDVHGRPVTEG